MQYRKMAAWALALGLLVSFSASSAVAQDAATSGSAAGGPGGGGGGRRGGGGMYGIALQVSGLTAEQKEKLEKGQTESRTKMQEMRKNGGGGGWGSPEFQKMQDEQKSNIESILNDEQKKEFETKLSEMRSRMGGGRMGAMTSGTAEKK